MTITHSTLMLTQAVIAFGQSQHTDCPASDEAPANPVCVHHVWCVCSTTGLICRTKKKSQQAQCTHARTHTHTCTYAHKYTSQLLWLQHEHELCCGALCCQQLFASTVPCQLCYQQLLPSSARFQRMPPAARVQKTHRRLVYMHTPQTL